MMLKCFSCSAKVDLTIVGEILLVNVSVCDWVIVSQMQNIAITLCQWNVAKFRLGYDFLHQSLNNLNSGLNIISVGIQIK